ncbi:MAG: hypothetical protein ABSF65_10055, partial [Candidatus Bathyarchaeia archaeon]
ETWAKRSLHSESCLSHPSQSRDNISTPNHDTRHKSLIQLSTAINQTQWETKRKQKKFNPCFKAER